MVVTMDNNFLHYFKKISEGEKNRVRELVKDKKVEFLLTDILIRELLGLLGKNEEKLKKHCIAIKDLECIKIFKNIPKIMHSEIIGKHDEIYYSSKIEKKIQSLISTLAISGKLEINEEKRIRDILIGPRDYINDWKNAQEANLKKVRTEIKKKINEKTITKEQNYKFLKVGFNPYYALKLKEKVSHLYYFLRINKVCVSENKIKKIVDNARYPHLNAWLRCEFALHYKQLRDNYSAIKANSLNDILYLVYIPKVDFLISDDKLVSEISDTVYGEKKVLKFKEFCEKVKIKDEIHSM